MSEELSEKEMQALFHSTSKAIRENDFDKLTELSNAKEESSKEDTPEEVVKTEKEEPAKEVPEVETKEEIPPKEEEKKEVPPEKAELEVVEKKEAPSELDMLKEKFDRLSKENHDLRSQAGRVPAVQRRISELDKKLADLEKKSKEAPTSQHADEVKELLKGVSETDPELADAIAAAINKATSKVSNDVDTKEVETLKMLRATEYQEYATGEVNRLLAMYPNAKEVFADPNWTAWKQSQSKGIVNLADSDNADDVSYAFQKYAEDMAAKYPELVKKEAVKETPAATPNPEQEKAAQIEAERKRKKEAAVNIGSPNAAGKVEVPNDLDALFKKYSDDIRKQRLGG